MTTEQRQALRGKHRIVVNSCDWCHESWPCDVIKVLDALETALNADSGPACTHSHQTADFDGVPVETPYSSAFCPDCGASLE